MQLSNSSVRIDSGELSSTQRRLRALRRRHDADIHSLVRCEIHENIDIDRLRSALRTVMNRHEILLTRYPAESGAPWISKACTPDREPAHEVLSSWPEGTNRPADDAESVYSALRNEAHSSDTEPCAKFILVKSADDRFHLLGRVPGMNADRRSIHRLIEEWNSAYRDSPE